MTALLIRGMRGLGDNLFQRALLHAVPGVYLDTPWPELYADMDVRCVRADTTLRTQRENVQRSAYAWHATPAKVRALRIGYGSAELARGSIVEALRRQLAAAEVQTVPRYSLPEVPAWPCAPELRIAVVRPVTVRSEWRNEARNPRAEYMAEAASELQRRGYHVVSVAHLVEGQEWAVGPLPPADTVLHRGELDVVQLMSLLRRAQVAVGGVGWLLPMAVSAGTPLYVIQGGHGGHNAPGVVTDPSMDLSRVGWARPDRYCGCTSMLHACDKTISGFADGFSRWLEASHLAG